MKSTTSFSFLKLLLFVLLGFAVNGSWAFAGTSTWTGGTSGDWNTAGNWNSGVGPAPGVGTTSDTAQFDSGSGSTSITLSGNVNGGVGTVINLVSGETGNVSINNGTAGTLSFRVGGISIASGDGAFTFGATSGTADTIDLSLGTTGTLVYDFTNNSSNLATYGTNVVIETGGSNTSTDTVVFNGSGNSLVSGRLDNQSSTPLALVQSGSGTLTLSNNNIYNGGTLISGGTVIASNNNALGFAGKQFINTNKGTTVNGATAASALDLTGASLVNQAITLSGGANGTNLIVTSGTTTLSNGVAEVDFTNAGTGYAAPTGTTVIFNNTGTGGSGAIATAALTGTSVLDVALSAAGSGYTSAPTVSIAGGSGFNGVAVLSSVTLNGTNNNIGGNGNLIVNAAIADGTSSGGFTKIGSGAVTLTGSNTYSGGTIISTGTLVVNNTSGSATGSGGLQLISGAVLTGTGTIAVTTGTGNATISGTINVGNGGTTDVLTMTASGTTDFTGASLKFNLDSTTPGNSSKLALGNTPTVNFGNTSLTINLAGSTILTNSTDYILFTSTATSDVYTGLTLSGSIITDGLHVTVTGTNAALYSGAYLELVSNNLGGDNIVVVVPEPGAWALMLGGLSLLMIWQRRKRQNY